MYTEKPKWNELRHSGDPTLPTMVVVRTVAGAYLGPCPSTHINWVRSEASHSVRDWRYATIEEYHEHLPKYHTPG